MARGRRPARIEYLKPSAIAKTTVSIIPIAVRSSPASSEKILRLNFAGTKVPVLIWSFIS